MRTFQRMLLLTGFTLALALCCRTAQAQAYSDLHDFNCIPEGCQPSVPSLLAQGRDGNLYGTLPIGGITGSEYGTVFKMSPSGIFTKIHDFDIARGSSPQSGLTLGLDGSLYGTTHDGGFYCCGTAFKITPSGTLTILHSFSNFDGAYLYAGVTLGKDGNYYGVTQSGTGYRVSSSGIFKLLSTTVPYWAWSNLIQAIDGNFYGASHGRDDYGAIYKMSSSGATKIIYNFDDTLGAYGAESTSPLVQASDGNFYGTTQSGGSSTSCGEVFKVTPTGAFSILYAFAGSLDGCAPEAGLVLATDGNLYGVTRSGGTYGKGTFFRLSKSGTAYTILHHFDGRLGSAPVSTPLQHTNGKFYGLTMQGGPYAFDGVFYSLSVGLKPFIRTMTTSGKAGQSVQILGQGFTATSVVKFGTGSATISSFTPTFMIAVIPATGTTGSVTVTTPTGTLTSNTTFKVIPTLTSFSPTTGTVGSSVVLTGTALSQTSKVTFGGVKATSFTINSATQVTATVPVGGKTGNIVVTTPGGTASKGTFTVY